MRYSKSMYWAGWVIDADECDYNSSKQLGLLCPFCSEAVYLIRGYTRKMAESGKEHAIRASFGHYESESKSDVDVCELRSTRPEGKEYIEKLKMEGRNQRLKLFNRRFIEIFMTSHKIPPRDLKYCKQSFGEKWLTKTYQLVRVAWRQQRAEISRNSEDYFNLAIKQSALELPPELKDFQEFMKQHGGGELTDEIDKIYPPERRQAHLARMQSYDAPFHLSICNEAIEFLATRTAGYALEKMVLIAAVKHASVLAVMKYGSASDWEYVLEMIPETRKAQVSELINIIAGLIGNADWVTAFKAEL